MGIDRLFDKWCGDHPKCKGCRFHGNECVAPEASHKFNDWLLNMASLITEETENARLTSKNRPRIGKDSTRQLSGSLHEKQ